MMQDLSGQKLGQYELRERLGRGGMAEVYKAYQPGMDRFVAIKIMLAHLSDDDQFIERFKREAQAVGKLRHSHIVQVFDFGIENGMYYMVMEYIQSDTLKAYIHEKGKLTAHEALLVTGQLADALEYAHKAGMIHRDLKPANVMFINKDPIEVVLTDFGIARILSKTGLTGTGMSVGTPAYMSPESGRGEDADERADLYALGIMLYEMLTGTPPYDADTPFAVILKHINAPLPTLRDYGDDVPEIVEGLILKLMAKDPADRFQTATDVKKTVRQILRTLSSEAPTVKSPLQAQMSHEKDKPKEAAKEPDTVSMPGTKLQRKSNNMLWIGVASLILLIAVGGGIIWFVQDDGSFSFINPVVDEPPQRPSDRQPGNQNRDLPPAFFMETNQFEQLPPPNPRSLNLIADAISPAVRETDEDYVYRGLGVALDNTLHHVEEDPDNFDWLLAHAFTLSLHYDENSQEVAQRLVEMAPDDFRSYIALSDAYLSYPNYDTDKAREAILRAQELRADEPEILWRLASLSAWDEVSPRFNEAEAMGASGFRFVRFAGYHLYGSGEFERAIPYLESQLTAPNEEISNYEIKVILMGALMHTGQDDEAFEIAKRIAEGEPFAARYADIAYVAWRSDNGEEARNWSNRALALNEEQYDALWMKALITYYEDKDVDEAMDILNSLEDKEFYPSYLNESFGHTLSIDRARIYWDDGEPELALEWFNRAIEEHDWHPEWYEQRAELHLEMDNIEAARNDLRVAIDMIDDPGYKDILIERLVELSE